MIVVDTNVISEIMKASPSSTVIGWLSAQHNEELYITSVTFAEILYGIERLPDGRRKELLRTTAIEVFEDFNERILPFDAKSAVHYSLIVDTRDRIGSPIDGFDAQIAAICRTHSCILATRNIKDFEHTGLDLIDPWLHV